MVSFNSSMNFNNEIEELELDLPTFIGNGQVLVAESSGRTLIVSDDEYKKNKRERVSLYEDVLAVIENVLDNVEIEIADDKVKKIPSIEIEPRDWNNERGKEKESSSMIEKANDFVKFMQLLGLKKNDDNILLMKGESSSGESAIGKATEGESQSIQRVLVNDVVKSKKRAWNNMDDENIFLKGESSNCEIGIPQPQYVEKESKAIQIVVDINNNDAVDFSKGESLQDELKIDLIGKENALESKEVNNFPNQSETEEQQSQEKTPSLKILSESQELIISHLDQEENAPALNLDSEMEMKDLIVVEKVELRESSTMTSQPMLLSQETSMPQKLTSEAFTNTSQPMCISQETSMSQIYFNDNCTMTSQPMKLSQETWMSQTDLIESCTNTSQPMLITQETSMSQPFASDTCTMTSQSLIAQEDEEKEEKVNLEVEVKDCETNTSQSIPQQDSFLEHNESPKNQEEIKKDEPFVDETDSKEISLQNEVKNEQNIHIPTPSPLVLSPALPAAVDRTDEIDQNQKKMAIKRKHVVAKDKKSKKRRNKKSRKSKKKRDPRNYDPEIIWTKSASGKEYAYEGGEDGVRKPKKSKKKKSSALVRLGLSKSKKPSKILHESFHLRPVKVYSSSSSEESSDDDSDSSSSSDSE